MKVSVIIPVFRTAATLRRCVESVRAQDFSDWEMLLVDDGSDDSAPDMCDDYARKDHRIKALHQSNKGLGAARNTGIRHAKGDYLFFLDSDDYIESCALSTALRALEKHPEARFAEFGLFKHEADGEVTEISFPMHLYHGKWDYWFNAKGYEHCYACNKLFRREAFREVEFKEGKKFEDVFTMLNLLKEEGKYLTMPQQLYHYCYNQAGITATAGSELGDLLEALVTVFQTMGWKRPNGVRREAYLAFCLHALNVQIDVYDRCGSKKLWLHTLPFSLSPKMIAQKILGMPLFCKTFCMLRSLCKKSL